MITTYPSLQSGPEATDSLSQSWGLALTGVCGSGKSTVARVLAGLLEWPLVSSGDVARSVDENTRRSGAMADPYALDDALLPLLMNGPVVLDGYPRTPTQAFTLRAFGKWDIVALSITPSEAERRLLERGRSDDTRIRIGARITEQMRAAEGLRVDATIPVLGLSPGEIAFAILSSPLIDGARDEEI